MSSEPQDNRPRCPMCGAPMKVTGDQEAARVAQIAQAHQTIERAFDGAVTQRTQEVEDRG